VKEVAATYNEAVALGVKRYWGVCKHHPGPQVKWVTNRSCAACCTVERKKYQKRNAKKLVVKRAEWTRFNRNKAMLQRARYRAKQSGLDYDLAPEDVTIPEVCPVLGIQLSHHGPSDNYPSLDRIDNTKGYVKGNVVVVSYLANRLKSNATIDQLRKVASFYAKYTVGKDHSTQP